MKSVDRCHPACYRRTAPQAAPNPAASAVARKETQMSNDTQHLGGPIGRRTSSCATELVCRDCGYRTALAERAFKCPACGEGLDIDYDYERATAAIAERGLEGRPWNIWRFEELLPITSGRRPGAGRPVRRPDAADPRRPARRRARPEEALPEGRLDQPSVALLQGPRRRHGDRPPAGAGQGRGRLRLDRQRRHRGRGARRQGRRHRLRLLPRQHGEGEGESLSRPRRPGLPARRQLRPGQPRLSRALAGERDRVRQHHPAAVLRRGGEDDGLRGGRGARLERRPTTSSSRPPAARSPRASTRG